MDLPYTVTSTQGFFNLLFLSLCFSPCFVHFFLYFASCLLPFPSTSSTFSFHFVFIDFLSSFFIRFSYDSFTQTSIFFFHFFSQYIALHFFLYFFCRFNSYSIPLQELLYRALIYFTSAFLAELLAPVF